MENNLEGFKGGDRLVLDDLISLFTLSILKGAKRRPGTNGNGALYPRKFYFKMLSNMWDVEKRVPWPWDYFSFRLKRVLGQRIRPPTKAITKTIFVRDDGVTLTDYDALWELAKAKAETLRQAHGDAAASHVRFKGPSLEECFAFFDTMVLFKRMIKRQRVEKKAYHFVKGRLEDYRGAKVGNIDKVKFTPGLVSAVTSDLLALLDFLGYYFEHTREGFKNEVWWRGQMEKHFFEQYYDEIRALIFFNLRACTCSCRGVPPAKERCSAFLDLFRGDRYYSVLSPYILLRGRPKAIPFRMPDRPRTQRSGHADPEMARRMEAVCMVVHPKVYLVKALRVFDGTYGRS